MADKGKAMSKGMEKGLDGKGKEATPPAQDWSVDKGKGKGKDVFLPAESDKGKGKEAFPPAGDWSDKGKAKGKDGVPPAEDKGKAKGKGKEMGFPPADGLSDKGMSKGKDGFSPAEAKGKGKELDWSDKGKGKEPDFSDKGKAKGKGKEGIFPPAEDKGDKGKAMGKGKEAGVPPTEDWSDWKGKCKGGKGKEGKDGKGAEKGEVTGVAVSKSKAMAMAPAGPSPMAEQQDEGKAEANSDPPAIVWEDWKSSRKSNANAKEGGAAVSKAAVTANFSWPDDGAREENWQSHTPKEQATAKNMTVRPPPWMAGKGTPASDGIAPTVSKAAALQAGIAPTTSKASMMAKPPGEGEKAVPMEVDEENTHMSIISKAAMVGKSAPAPTTSKASPPWGGGSEDGWEQGKEKAPPLPMPKGVRKGGKGEPRPAVPGHWRGQAESNPEGNNGSHGEEEYGSGKGGQWTVAKGGAPPPRPGASASVPPLPRPAKGGPGGTSAAGEHPSEGSSTPRLPTPKPTLPRPLGKTLAAVPPAKSGAASGPAAGGGGSTVSKGQVMHGQAPGRPVRAS